MPLNSAPYPRLVEFSPVTNQELLKFAQRAESEQLEFKQSSAQFPRAGETLCAFMNYARYAGTATRQQPLFDSTAVERAP
jgi:hypothetical protein